MKRQRRAQESESADNADGSTEGEAATVVDWSYLSGSNETYTDGFGIVHVESNDTDAWEDLFPNGSTVKIVYQDGSGSTDTIIILPAVDDDSGSSTSEDRSTSGSIDATVSPVYDLPTADSSSSSSSTAGSASVESSTSSASTTLTLSIIFAVIAVVVVVGAVFFVRKYTSKQRSNARARTYDLSTMFQVVRQRRRTSSPSILGDATDNYNQSSPLRPTTIMADTETLAPMRPTVSLTPPLHAAARRAAADRFTQYAHDSNRLRASTAPVVLFEDHPGFRPH